MRKSPFKKPSTYAEIVAFANDAHARRLAELKRAEKHIRAIQGDLTLLDEQGIYFDAGEYSMRLEDCRPASQWNARAQYALRIGTGISNMGDRTIGGFMALGWIVERIRSDRMFANVVLRRPKTQLRVLLDGSEALVNSLQPQEVA